MRQVRQRQQEIADERAKEAASKRKEKEVEEKERKNHVAKNKPATNGNRLGDGRNPATSNTSSYRYDNLWMRTLIIESADDC